MSALRTALPNEDFVYLGDTARLPYGTKSADTVRRYATQAARQLVDRGVKALVIACNTASAFALQHLKNQVAPLPGVGVVEPGAQAAVAAADASGVLGGATVCPRIGGAFPRALSAAAPQLPVYGRACPLWVTLVEQGPPEPEFTHGVLAHALRGFMRDGPHTLLLGCTHFPVFRPSLDTLLDEHAGRHIVVVDSADTTAAAVSSALHSEGLLGARPSAGSTRYLATDGVARFTQVGAHFLGDAITGVELVDL